MYSLSLAYQLFSLYVFFISFLQALQLEVLPVVVPLVLANSSRSLNLPQTVHILPFALTSVLIFHFHRRDFVVIASSLEYQYLTTRFMNTVYLHFSHS
nr:MAG TPA: hypothetical protein [Bacteriophage sp.]